MTHTPIPVISAVLPLSVLEAMRGLDQPLPDALDEFHGELTAKRLGLSETVQAEIERLERVGRRGGAVPAADLAALVRLAARRHDAQLVFSEAGRRAARRAVAELPAVTRVGRAVLPGELGRRVGWALARRQAARVFGTTLRVDSGVVAATLGATYADVTEPGAPCGLFGSGLAELLRRLAAFDGAMVHVTCRARGDSACTWRAATLHD